MSKLRAKNELEAEAYRDTPKLKRSFVAGILALYQDEHVFFIPIVRRDFRQFLNSPSGAFFIIIISAEPPPDRVV